MIRVDVFSDLSLKCYAFTADPSNFAILIGIEIRKCHRTVKLVFGIVLRQRHTKCRCSNVVLIGVDCRLDMLMCSKGFPQMDNTTQSRIIGG